MTHVTRILNLVEDGDPKATEQLLPLVYDELRKLAATRMFREPSDHSLTPTGLVHEAYVRLVGDDHSKDWNNRGHFFAAAAEAMRRILIERARKKQRLKHGGGRKRLDLDQIQLGGNCPTAELLALDEALESLAESNAAKAELVKLRFFAGCTTREAASILGISPATAKRYWLTARAFLFANIKERIDAEKKN